MSRLSIEKTCTHIILLDLDTLFKGFNRTNLIYNTCNAIYVKAKACHCIMSDVLSVVDSTLNDYT